MLVTDFHQRLNDIRQDYLIQYKAVKAQAIPEPRMCVCMCVCVCVCMMYDV